MLKGSLLAVNAIEFLRHPLLLQLIVPQHRQNTNISNNRIQHSDIKDSKFNPQQMEFYTTTNFPLRFSSLFWMRDRNDTPQLTPTTPFKQFKSHIIVNTAVPRGVDISIAAPTAESVIRGNHVYEIEGQVTIGATSLPTITEDCASTVSMDNGELRVNSMANKVKAQGIGRIVDWSCRAPTTICQTEVVKVMHQGRDPMSQRQIVFHANYVIQRHLACTLSPGALDVGNIIVLRGNVVDHDSHSGTWEIDTTEIQMVYCKVERKRSRRQRGLEPIAL